jgi:cell division protein FtsL
MMMRRFFFYLMVLTIPLFLGLVAWQSSRYVSLEREISRLEDAQVEWLESNKRLIAGISVLSSAERIEYIAQKELELNKIPPEDVLQIRIEGRGKDLGL